MSDWDALRNFLPTSFGKQEEKKDFTQEFEKTKREVHAVDPLLYRSNHLYKRLLLRNLKKINLMERRMDRKTANL